VRRSFAFLGAAIAALCMSALAAHDAVAIPPPPQYVNDAAVLEGMPRTLSEFGFFDNGPAQIPVPHVYPYTLNTPLFSDGADKLRFIYRAGGTQFTPGADDEGGLLNMPVGAAIIKTFAYGEGEERRLIETRVLLHRESGWVALPYRWNEEQTEARLAIAGARIPITTPGGEEISYRIPNMNQCKTCHAQDGAITPIGPKARNLSVSWLERAVGMGQLSAMPEGADVLPVWQTAQGSTHARARAYLDVNCAHCHKPGGSASNTGLDLRWEQDDPFAIGVRKPPVAAGRGAGGLLVSIEPGAPDASILVHRMNSAEPGVAMPELGRSTIDHDAVALMREWIEEMDQ